MAALIQRLQRLCAFNGTSHSRNGPPVTLPPGSPPTSGPLSTTFRRDIERNSIDTPVDSRPKAWRRRLIEALADLRVLAKASVTPSVRLPYPPGVSVARLLPQSGSLLMYDAAVLVLFLRSIRRGAQTTRTCAQVVRSVPEDNSSSFMRVPHGNTDMDFANSGGLYDVMDPRIRYLYKNTVSHFNNTSKFRSYPIRTLYATPGVRRAANDLSQGHAANPENLHPQDVQSEAVRKGKEAGKDGKNEAIDAANEGDGRKPKKTGPRGNPERIGFVEQVGGASGSARKFEKMEEERK